MEECERSGVYSRTSDTILWDVVSGRSTGLSHTITRWLVSQISTDSHSSDRRALDTGSERRRFDLLFWRVTVELFCSMQERLSDEQVSALLSFVNKHSDRDKLTATALLIDLAPSLHPELVASLADRIFDILVVESSKTDLESIHDELLRLSDTLMTVQRAVVV